MTEQIRAHFDKWLIWTFPYANANWRKQRDLAIAFQAGYEQALKDHSAVPQSVVANG